MHGHEYENSVRGDDPNDDMPLLHTPPEILNPDLLKPKKKRVLILASYCGDDDPNCTDNLPCNECLRMCNVAEVTVGLDDVVGQFEQLETTLIVSADLPLIGPNFQPSLGTVLKAE